ncbi:MULTISPECIES: dihydrofolate reductase [Furfurilactobacillus]|uniref:dihydrofolate reductase n=1 Tax=Furfurilactobacillus TaxID=2767882 RepID=UPI00136DA975|nr:dihydrofolate reductase [Furfurilactobacillus milii]
MLTLIWAEDQHHLIGRNGQLPWHLPADARYFRQQTTGNAVIMGKRTFESLGKPLPNRKNLVLSSTLPEQPGILLFPILAELANWITHHPDDQLFVIGGVRLYKELMSMADRLLVTKIDATFDGDTYMPAVNLDDWTLQSTETHEADDKNRWPYAFLTYVRRPHGVSK